MLSWPAVAGASGYIVWEATETALYDAVAGTAPPTGQTIRARAQDLKTRILANQAASLSTFSRLNERPARGHRRWSSSCRAARTRSSSTGCPRSPRRTSSPRGRPTSSWSGCRGWNGPGRRTSRRRYDAAADEVVLTIVPGTGLVPDRLAVHRVRTPLLAEVIDTMGPAAGDGRSRELTAVQVPSLGGAPPVPGYRWSETVQPGWRPYVYRVVALGRDLPADGIRSGRSPASGAATVVVPPALPPVLSGLTVARNGSATLLTFSTDLPSRPTPAGPASLVVATVDAAGTRTTLATFDPATDPRGPGAHAADGARTGRRDPAGAGGRDGRGHRAGAADDLLGRHHRDRPARPFHRDRGRLTMALVDTPQHERGPVVRREHAGRRAVVDERYADRRDRRAVAHPRRPGRGWRPATGSCARRRRSPSARGCSCATPRVPPWPRARAWCRCTRGSTCGWHGSTRWCWRTPPAPGPDEPPDSRPGQCRRTWS